MYRPKNWKNPYDPGCRAVDYDFTTKPAQVYEAGADAMLEALKKIREPAKQGWTIFIPDIPKEPLV